MGSRRTPEQWRRLVFRSSLITDADRVMLLYLAEHLRADLTVSVPREQVAKALGRSERRITSRVTAAHKAGFLDTVSKGRKGRTAVYAAMFPNHDSETVCSPLNKSSKRPADSQFSGTPGCPTTTTAEPLPGGWDSNDGSDDTGSQHVVAAVPYPWPEAR